MSVRPGALRPHAGDRSDDSRGHLTDAELGPSRGADPHVVARSASMRGLRDLAARAGATGAKVLITGESGVGKDVIARYVHAHSTRAHRPLIIVNCAAFNENLLESELFGHVKGSFTGAHRDKPGKLQLAHRGTIFLDELGEMSLRMQAMLLRFLENGELQPVGADFASTRVDVRVIAATNRDLDQMVAQGQFRQDLLYRLRVVQLHIPPLRERPDDIRGLVEHFAECSGRSIRFSVEAQLALERYAWPGNIRELHNVLEQIAWMAQGPVIELGDLPPAVRGVRDGSGRSLIETPRPGVTDDIYDGLVSGRYSFWNDVHAWFLNRDLTRHDVRDLVRRGLQHTQGNYRALLRLFGMDETDYKKFHNFLAAHECALDFHAFRPGRAERPQPAPAPPPPALAVPAPGAPIYH